MENELNNGTKNERRDATRDKVFLFVIGVLVGAVISTGAFLAYIKIAGVGSGQSSQMQGGGTPPEMPSGSSGNGQGGTPPEMPSGSSGNSQSSTPPEMPSNSTQNNSN